MNGLMINFIFMYCSIKCFTKQKAIQTVVEHQPVTQLVQPVMGCVSEQLSNCN